MATKAQVEYIEILLDNLGADTEDYGVEDIYSKDFTVSEAIDLIDELKRDLGWG